MQIASTAKVQGYKPAQKLVEPIEGVQPVQAQYPGKKDKESFYAEEGARVLDDNQLASAVEKAVKALEGPSTNFEVAYQENSSRIMIKVRDKDTGEVIREIPPEKTRDVLTKMAEIAGILIDEKV